MPTLFFILLYPFSVIYGGLMQLRNKCYDWNLFKTTRFKLPIISVGNLSLGGTGKTPHTEYIIRLLQDEFNTAILSRGYKRKTKGFYLADSQTSVLEIGDEPLQYHLKFKKTTVAVSEKRVDGVVQILKQAPKTDVIILDDAFQHRPIAPGCNILITAQNNLYVDDTVFPSGRLREWKTGSERADIIIVSKTSPDLTALEKAEIQAQLRPKAHQKLFFSYVKYGNIVPLTKAAQHFNVIENSDTSLLLLTGIANPQPLLDFLNPQYSSVQHLQFKDHHNYSVDDTQQIMQQFDAIVSENKLIISTEKDAMRLSLPHVIETLQHLPIFYIPIEICFHGDDKKEFDRQLLEYVKKTSI